MKILVANMAAIQAFAKLAALDDFAFVKLSEQFRGGKTWVALRDGKAMALFGLHEHREDGLTLEAWFQCLPRAAPRMLQLVRAMRTLLCVEMSRLRPTVTYVMPGHAPGERLAKLLGFVATGEIFNAPGTPVHGVQFWRYRP